MEISEIKQQLSIEQVLRHYGLEMNANKHINCPFHDDKTPSMRVYPKTGTVYCFSGNCTLHGKSLDVIDFIMHKESCSKYEAITKAKGMLGYVQVVEEKLSLDKVFNSMCKGFSQTKKAQAYAEHRGLSGTSLALGYNSGQGHHGKTKQFLKALEALHILKPLAQGGYQTFGKYCLIFGLKDRAGRVCSLYGRKINGQGHYYLKGRTGLYPSYLPSDTQRLILTESVIDAASLLQLKTIKAVYQVLALYGTNGLTEEHLEHLKSLQELKEIVLLMDGDDAGRAASRRHKTTLEKILPYVKIKVIDLPENTDVNELWANHRNEQLFVDMLGVGEDEQVEKVTQETAINELIIKNKNDIRYVGEYAYYAIKGGVRASHWDSLKITLVTENKTQRKYRGKVDLYDDSAVQKYLKAASQKLGLNPDLLDLDLSLLTDKLEIYRAEGMEKLEGEEEELFKISELEKLAARQFLSTENLLKRLNEKIGATGIVGEEQNRLLLLMVASSYAQKKPLHALIQGSSGSGKTLLLRKIMDLLPPTQRHIWTRITDKSLYHAGKQYCHKSLAIEDWDGLSEEVQYVLRELQSGQILRSSTTEKLQDGRMVSKEVITYGPIASLLCTTKGSVYEDNMSRCFLVAVNEEQAQTERILQYQYAKDRGEINQEDEQRNSRFIQTLVASLAPMEVVNPFAGKVELPKEAHKIRRLNGLYQCFVQQITWWHQHQRKRDERGRLIVEISDLKAALHLLFETIILKVDELDGSLRSFFEWLKTYLKEADKQTFTQREVRQARRISKTGCQNYMNQLIELEYIERCFTGRRNTYHYQISYWDDASKLRNQLKNSLSKQLESLSDH